MSTVDQHQWLAFEPDTVASMTTAFDAAVLSLRLMAHEDGLRYQVAKKIIEIARSGERDPARICQRALEDLRR